MGYKIKKGIIIPINTLTVLVSKKVPEIALSKDNLIPSSYKGIPTDVIESGLITPNSLTSRIRPAIGGYSISTVIDAGAGTLGCLVQDYNRKYLLSCNHILALFNAAPIGTEIIQPGAYDSGKADTDVIARLSRFIPLKIEDSKFEGGNTVDCAIAELVDPNIAISSIAYIGKPKGIKVPQLLEEVKKIGRTTEQTVGFILLLNATFRFQSPSGDVYVYKKQIITSKMSEIGDSGAILLSKDNYALGLLNGSADTISTHSLIDLVLVALNIFLVTE